MTNPKCPYCGKKMTGCCEMPQARFAEVDRYFYECVCGARSPICDNSVDASKAAAREADMRREYLSKLGEAFLARLTLPKWMSEKRAAKKIMEIWRNEQSVSSRKDD